ncbi:SseB family protein [Psychromarinibacter halotolerans]|uniref:SseB family protein n=1 Tax=Psychromarinibacter halotolerans TaxID=1775175 RepID=A0ABV7GNH4_9RHOB|nr:SseB family protein [Psychromarinibacter halotolerans]MDF0596909.1 SseB family protein [Psychromarinibacter halotolerans]
MTEHTPIDRAHAAMDAAPGDDAVRLRFYERLADAELVLLLAKDADGDNVEPELFEVQGGRFVLAFDSEQRLADFVGRTAPYAALSGRALAGMLAGQGIGLGLNLEVAPSSILIPDAAVDWLAETLGRRPAEVAEHPEDIARPEGVPDLLLQALDQKLVSAAGLAPFAYLASVTYRGGARGHLLAFVDAAEGSEGALAQAVGEALTFSGLEAGALDVGFFAASDPVSATLARHGLRIDLPEPEVVQTLAPGAPGMDPAKPPKLR